MVNCLQEVVTFIDQNRGWTVIGWYKHGQINNKTLLLVEQEGSIKAVGADLSYRNDLTQLSSAMSMDKLQFIGIGIL